SSCTSGRKRPIPPPTPVRNLLELIRLRVDAAGVGVESIAAKEDHLTVILAPRNRLDDKTVARLWRHPVANRPGWRWVQVRPDRIVVELQGGSALGAAAAVVRALAEPAPARPSSKGRQGSATRRNP
ncbi:MAG TPA: hypothetical protein PLY56_07280, partial [Armatimonadota bacterium]|nr:hypothetical protein [Armatimonadota bacterium]